MKLVIVGMLLLVIIIASGCTTATPAPQDDGSSSPATGEPYSRRDNISGAEAFDENGGTGLLDSDLSIDDISALAYRDTMKDLPPEQRDPDCSHRSNQESIDSCLHDAAIYSLDTDTCNLISDEIKAMQCIRAIAVVQDSADTCMLISRDVTQYSCIAKIAVNLVDESICNRIPPTHPWNKKCHENIKNEIESISS